MCTVKKDDFIAYFEFSENKPVQFDKKLFEFFEIIRRESLYINEKAL
jgi:hypothetical protein